MKYAYGKSVNDIPSIFLSYEMGIMFVINIALCYCNLKTKQNNIYNQTCLKQPVQEQSTIDLGRHMAA